MRMFVYRLDGIDQIDNSQSGERYIGVERSGDQCIEDLLSENVPEVSCVTMTTLGRSSQLSKMISLAWGSKGGMARQVAHAGAAQPGCRIGASGLAGSLISSAEWHVRRRMSGVVVGSACSLLACGRSQGSAAPSSWIGL
jgi:hypothetical protein